MRSEEWEERRKAEGTEERRGGIIEWEEGRKRERKVQRVGESESGNENGSESGRK